MGNVYVIARSRSDAGPDCQIRPLDVSSTGFPGTPWHRTPGQVCSQGKCGNPFEH